MSSQSAPARARPSGGGEHFLIKLIGLWFFLQLFSYQDMSPDFTFHAGISFTPDRVCFLLIIGVALYQRLVGRLEPSPWEGAEIFMAAFTAYVFASWFITGIDSETGSFRWLTTIFQFTVFPFSLFLIVKRLPFDRQWVDRLFGVVWWIGLYLALTAIFEHYRIDFLVWPSYILDPAVGLTFGRSRGPFVNTAMTGWVLIVFVIIGIMWFSRSEARGKRGLFVCLALGLVALYFTETRGNWAALAIVLASFGLFSRNMRRPTLYLVALIIVGFLSGEAEKFAFGKETLFSKREVTVDYRLANYQVAFNVFLQKPWVGVGYGGLGQNLETYFMTQDFDSRFRTLDDGNHNIFLGLAVELGLAGLLLYLGVLLTLAQRAFSLHRRLDSSRGFEKNLALSCLTLVAVFFFMGQLGDLRFHLLTHNLLFLFLALAVGLDEATRRKEDSA